MYPQEISQNTINYLNEHGWYIRHTNWEYENKSLGLVCIDSDMTVLLFVIVCTQKESLKKLTNDIVSAASDYVRDYHLEHLPVRFDRLIITGTNDNNVITHEENVLPTIDLFLLRRISQQATSHRETKLIIYGST